MLSELANIREHWTRYRDVTLQHLDMNRGSRISLRLIDRPMVAGSLVIDELTITAPLTRDNFEGVSVVARSVDVYRFYLISDDNFTQTQHTYLMAFDWKQ
jgi:hypothetical protein